MTIPKVFAVLYCKVQGKFFLGDEASYVDVQLAVVLAMITEAFANADLSVYPKLLAVVKQVKVNPGVAAYLATRD